MGHTHYVYYTIMDNRILFFLERKSITYIALYTAALSIDDTVTRQSAERKGQSEQVRVVSAYLIDNELVDGLHIERNILE